MTATTEPAPALAAVLDGAARGVLPPADGAVRVLGSPGGRADAVVAFTGHLVVAADVDPDEVGARLAPGDFSAWLAPPFLSWLGERLGTRPASHDAVLVATGVAGDAPVGLEEVAGLDHPRAARASRHRDGVRVFVADGGEGVLAVGRGLAGRYEVAFEVEPGARNAGLGRRLAAAARRLVPAGTPLWAQVAPANAASLRAVTAAGYVPVCAEVLFPRAG